ncbi:MAG: hypothetical protein HZB13_05115 [Acidobacteria bacterium]|nr:hypothetical protein [Acidobacteriota bacterium]
MRVDVTPGNAQAFRPKAGEAVEWSTTTGRSGMVLADSNGRVTALGITLNPGEPVTISFVRRASDASASRRLPVSPQRGKTRN